MQFPGTSQHATIDDCVRAVTAFSSFADLKNTQPTYAPTFYKRHAVTTFEHMAMQRVVSAFNAWADREGGRTRRAEIRA